MIKLRRLAKSFSYAFKGFVKTFREEQNLKIQTFTAVVVIALGVYFSITKTEWLFLIFVIGLVMLMELANSAVERVADILKPRIHEYVMDIKDIMAAAVMLASLIAVIIGVIIFWPYFFG
ncbi:MAG: diacylglycerol kinase family protein [Patescibacteria group bacterium]|nr:diacylglycerol kinase family protein [Patescibacteria group bacterium]